MSGCTVYRYVYDDGPGAGQSFYIGRGDLGRPDHSASGSGHNDALNAITNSRRRWHLEFIPGPDGAGISWGESVAIESILLSILGVAGGRGHVLRPVETSLLTNGRLEHTAIEFVPYVDLRLGLPERRRKLTPEDLRTRLDAAPGMIVVVPINPVEPPIRLAQQDGLARGGIVPPEWRAEWCLRYWPKARERATPLHLVAVTRKNWGNVIVGSYAIAAHEIVDGAGTYLPPGSRLWSDLGQSAAAHPLVGQEWLRNSDVSDVGGVCGDVLLVRLNLGPIYL